MLIKKKFKVAVLSLILLVVLIISGLYLFIQYRYNKDIMSNDLSGYSLIQADESNGDSTYESKEQSYEVESDIVNVLLVGVDTRGDFNDSRTDSIIIATVDPTSKKVKLTSLMRDMYLEIPRHGYQKINAAFELGGIELLKKTIKYNFGLDVNYYAAIDFRGFQDLIDKMDGVELEVKEYEVNEINKYIKDVNEDNSTLIASPGMQKLNGQQALSYCRIRKVGNNDFERTERQRRVLSLLLDKVKDAKIKDFPKIYSTVAPYLKTNVPFNSMLKLGYTVYKFENFTPETIRLPLDNHFKDTYVKDISVLIPELRYNANQLFKFVYGSVPGNLTVPNNSAVYNQKPETNGGDKNDQDTQGAHQPETKQPIQTPQSTPTPTPTPTPTSAQSNNPVENTKPAN